VSCRFPLLVLAAAMLALPASADDRARWPASSPMSPMLQDGRMVAADMRANADLVARMAPGTRIRRCVRIGPASRTDDQGAMRQFPWLSANPAAGGGGGRP
jgi:hypothetical protein